jgi:chromate transporter
MIHAQLFGRFVLISLLAFGGGQAALPLVERMAVDETQWIQPATFGAAVAFSYLTPGPVLITSTFIGYRVAGLLGALAATAGAFFMPWVLATAAAQQVARFAESSRLRAFGLGAAPAAVGILGVTALSLSRDALVAWPYLLIAAAAFLLNSLTRIHPIALLAAGGLAGWIAN